MYVYDITPTTLQEVFSANFDSRAGPVFVEWFRGGRTSIAYNCLDRHVAAGLGDR